MSMLDLVQGISQAPHNYTYVLMGKPGSGKTTLAGTFPKPLLYVSIEKDGGGEVLKCYNDNDVKLLQLNSDKPGAPNAKNIQQKVMELLNDLSGEHPYKTVVIDAYSSIEESMVNYFEKVKGKKLSLDERGTVGTLMLQLRDKIVELSDKVHYVLVTHIKDKETTDNTTGEKTTMIIPKMSYNNGNLLLERASIVAYCSKRTVINEDGSRRVAFLTYIGAHPNMDTKFRTEGKKLESGMYIENATFDKLEELRNSKQAVDNIEKLNVVESQENPFNDNDNKDDGEDW